MIDRYKILSESIEVSEIDTLLENLKKEYLIESSDESIPQQLGAAALVTLVIFILRWILFSLVLRTMGPKSEDKKLSKKLQEITGDSSIQVWKIKSKEVNAFNAGDSKLYYYTGIVKELKLTEGELIAILLHEYGHYRGKHVLKQELAYYPSVFILTFIFRYLTKNKTIHTAFIIVVPLHILMTVYAVTFGRKHEYESDRVMVEFGYKKEALSAFKKLYAYVRKEVCGAMKIPENSKECVDLINSLHALDEHPTFENRLKEILNTEAIKALSKRIMAKLKNILPLIKS